MWGWWVFTMLAALAVGCATPAGPVAGPAQPWELMFVDGRVVRVQVDTAAAAYDGVFTAAVDQYVDRGQEGLWSVVVHCSTGQSSAAAPVLATLDLAVGTLGEVQSRGQLQDGESTVEINHDQPCPVDEGDRSPEALAVAGQVLDAFTAAGLPVTDPRDNTGGNCGTARCAAWVTAEELTVIVFADGAAAAAYVGSPTAGSVEQVGDHVVLARLSDVPDGLVGDYLDAAAGAVADIDGPSQ